VVETLGKEILGQACDRRRLRGGISRTQGPQRMRARSEQAFRFGIGWSVGTRHGARGGWPRLAVGSFQKGDQPGYVVLVGRELLSEA
jgi:hypothetical protein